MTRAPGSQNIRGSLRLASQNSGPSAPVYGSDCAQRTQRSFNNRSISMNPIDVHHKCIFTIVFLSSPPPFGRPCHSPYSLKIDAAIVKIEFYFRRCRIVFNISRRSCTPISIPKPMGKKRSEKNGETRPIERGLMTRKKKRPNDYACVCAAFSCDPAG